MSVPRVIVSPMFWACALLLLVLGSIIDFWFYSGLPPRLWGTPGDAVMVGGIIALMLLWPKGRVWPDGMRVEMIEDESD